MTPSTITHRPLKLAQSSSVKIYLGLIAVLAIIYAFFTFLPVNYIVPFLGLASVWQEVILIGLLGFGGLWLSLKTGFPEMWDNQISHKQRFLVPALVGLVLGTMLVMFNQLILRLPGSLHIPFPASIFYYTYASIETEIVFRLIPIPLFVWLISVVLFRSRWQEGVFWGVAIILSLWEPLMQITGLRQMGLLGAMGPLVIGALFALIYGTNLSLAYFFRRSGFLAPLTMRLAIYLAWHVIFGALV